MTTRTGNEELEKDIKQWILDGIFFKREPFLSRGKEEDPMLKAWVQKGGLLVHDAVYIFKLYFESHTTSDFNPLLELLRNGADVNTRNYDKATPLHVAARTGNTTLVLLLFAQGCNLHAENMHGSTALHNAAREGSKSIVSFLIAHGCLINQLTDDGDTPLHQAVRKNNPENVRVLILAGADVNIKNYRGEKPRRVGCFKSTKKTFDDAMQERNERRE
jgi:ankyrin repeat protein